MAVERRVPDLLAEGDGMGMSIGDIARRTGIEERKLGRLLRPARSFFSEGVLLCVLWVKGTLMSVDVKERFVDWRVADTDECPNC